MNIDIIGEYPYYRDQPQLWRKKLLAMKEIGITHVSCYVPWRHHCSGPTSAMVFDSGDRDLEGFLRLMTELQMKCLIKPGPFIHAEVQLGGIPDFLSPSHDPSLAIAYSDRGLDCDSGAAPMMSQGKYLPHFEDPCFQRYWIEWLTIFAQKILNRYLHPHGPIVSVQLGNEGIYSDANLPLKCPLGTREDQASALIPAQLLAKRLQKMRQIIENVVKKFTSSFTFIATMPLPSRMGERKDDAPLDYHSWNKRIIPQLWGENIEYAFGSWVGNPLESVRAFWGKTWAIRRSCRASNTEENWGFLWDDPQINQHAHQIFPAIMALSGGAQAISIYCACATAHWGESIDLDRDFVKKQFGDEKFFGPPYAADAPINYQGEITEKGRWLQDLCTFLRASRCDSRCVRECRSVYEGMDDPLVILFDEQLTEDYEREVLAPAKVLYQLGVPFVFRSINEVLEQFKGECFRNFVVTTTNQLLQQTVAKLLPTPSILISAAANATTFEQQIKELFPQQIIFSQSQEDLYGSLLQYDNDHILFILNRSNCDRNFVGALMPLNLKFEGAITAEGAAMVRFFVPGDPAGDPAKYSAGYSVYSSAASVFRVFV
ncbi:MAG: beta-galactosidase [Oligoflexia bacterium]|nr:beta-galactosidase [Oligoflexia bacterium]